MPRYGFNFLWMFTYRDAPPPPPDLPALDLMAGVGLDFVRIPTDYNFWTRDFDYLHPDESVLEQIDGYLDACRQRDLHMCLNLHRAPGYCINRNDLERDNLWIDPGAQDGFVFLWEEFARRYRGVANDHLSFDLVNEPPAIDQYGMTRDNHAALVRRTVAAIRAVDPDLVHDLACRTVEQLAHGDAEELFVLLHGRERPEHLGVLRRDVGGSFPPVGLVHDLPDVGNHLERAVEAQLCADCVCHVFYLLGIG